MLESLRLKNASYTLLVLSLLSSALAQTTPGGTTAPGGSPETILTSLGCAFVRILSSPALVAVAALGLLMVFGWNKVFAEMSAFQSFKNGMIGCIIILAGGAIIASIFGAACGR